MRSPDHISRDLRANADKGEALGFGVALYREAADALDRLAAAHQETIRHARSGSDWDVVGSAAAARAVDLLEASS